MICGHRRRERGVTMLEVLITIFIVSFGMLGLAGLQARMLLAQVEAYQRAQAVTILKNMVSRLHAAHPTSSAGAAAYVTASPRGTDVGLQSCTNLVGAALDLCEWNNALVGASETSGGASVGAMTGARGCIESASVAAPYIFKVSVVWQGMSDTIDPASTTCGTGAYGAASKRRALIASVTIACFNNDAAGACIP
ncbi:MAG TPA: prepilin-type N-terminal cleavage/methylation domain-containing protein [Burkholderiales bacterium]|nr:prepilin-type N-terminal cleavage/methylation domain-containing protein [Burkholderiales bacterium]